MKKAQNKKINWKVLVASFIIVYLVAGLGSIFTSQNTKSDWYESIKPALTPPSIVFPIVWNILFFLIALSLYFCWTNSKNKEEKSTVSLVFGVNFILNIFWSILYFAMKNPRLAFFDIILLLASIASMLLLSWKISRKSFWLLVPYFLWVCFASVLNWLSI
jgi:tryptophan-rich sensory protein